MNKMSKFLFSVSLLILANERMSIPETGKRKFARITKPKSLCIRQSKETRLLKKADFDDRGMEADILPARWIQIERTEGDSSPAAGRRNGVSSP